MSVLFVFLSMIFCHVIADYNLQGWLASAKQKDYWEQITPKELYKHDYIMALIMHSISWTFMVMLPIAYVRKFSVGIMFLIVFIGNVIIHCIIDHMKANKKIINLWQDQLMHMIQIGITFTILCI